MDQEGLMVASGTLTVTITVEKDSVKIDPYYQTLKKANKDKMKWEIWPAGTRFRVHFTKTPFKKGEFDNDISDSGDIKDDAEVGKIYEYTVEIPSLATAIDPGIIIR
jgi:hypothetical protein